MVTAARGLRFLEPRTRARSVSGEAVMRVLSVPFSNRTYVHLRVGPRDLSRDVVSLLISRKRFRSLTPIPHFIRRQVGHSSSRLENKTRCRGSLFVS
jgi:hypothetical protein